MTTLAEKKNKGKIDRELRAIGKMIKTERSNQKLTLASLSTLSFGNPHAAKRISQIERGLLSGVEFMTIVKLLKALNIPVI